MSEIKFFDRVKEFMGIPLDGENPASTSNDAIAYRKLDPSAATRSDEVSRLEKLAKESPLEKLSEPLNSSELVVLEPRSFEECVEIVNHLRNNKSTIVNVHNMDVAQGQRLVDYICGAVLALDGNQERISPTIFLFAPGNVNVKSFAKSSEKYKDDGRIL